MRLAISDLSGISTRHIRTLLQSLSLEQIVCRTVDDPDITPHLQTRQIMSVSLSGRILVWALREDGSTNICLFRIIIELVGMRNC